MSLVGKRKRTPTNPSPPAIHPVPVQPTMPANRSARKKGWNDTVWAIAPEDKNLFSFVDSPELAWAQIKNFYQL